MTVAVEAIKPLQSMSLEEFLSYDNDTDILYELENGELVGMAPESDLNERIAIALLIYFSQVGVAQPCLRVKTEVVVSGTKPTVRIPDLSILQQFSLLCGTFRSPQPPLKKGAVKVPLFKGDLGRSFPTVPHYRAKRCICRSSVER